MRRLVRVVLVVNMEAYVMDHNFEYRRRLRQERLAEKRRQEQIRKVRFAATVFSVLFLTVAVVSANALIAAARDSETTVYHKYYTEVYVTSGDSVWKIADSYMSDSYTSVNDLVNEIIAINRLDSEGTIYYGTTIVVPYFSTEVLMSGSD
ncbi:MAG: LysM peptidoglycan-binding domain-containing protein [Lachnospiraceae bacterium]|nr:LysM peptidoglycan-binding domain-containing protein [Lachnospiraceae bacterium]